MKRCTLAMILIGSLCATAASANPTPKPVTLADIFAAGPDLTISEPIPEPILNGSCTITRYCDYPPPTSVSCTSQNGNCTLGATYVICDGVRQDCPAPPYYPNCPMSGSYCSGNPRTLECYDPIWQAVVTCFCSQNEWICPE